MKDLYSFDHTVEEAEKTYTEVLGAYSAIFTRMGIGEKVRMQPADNGDIGGILSHEWLLHGTHGEGELDGKPAHEVGHTFLLGNRYTDDWVMGCYGIGTSRLLPAILDAVTCEVTGGEQIMLWPPAISPFTCVIIPSETVDHEPAALVIASALKDKELDCCIDDRMSRRLSWRIVDAEKTGYAWIVVLGISYQSAGEAEVMLRYVREGKLYRKRWFAPIEDVSRIICNESTYYIIYIHTTLQDTYLT